MKRWFLAVLVVSSAFAASGCCHPIQICPVCPGSPQMPNSKIISTPQRPIVWRVLREGQVIALALQPLPDGVPWTVAYGSGVLPFRADDWMEEAADIPSGVPFTEAQLCTMLRDRIGLSNAQVLPEPFDLNALIGPGPCPP